MMRMSSILCLLISVLAFGSLLEGHADRGSPMLHSNREQGSLLDKLGQMFKPPQNDGSWWHDLVHPHEPTMLERIMKSSTESWSALIAGKAGDLLSMNRAATPPPQAGLLHRVWQSTAFTMARFVLKIGWVIAGEVLQGGYHFGLLTFDVVVFVLLLNHARYAVLGDSTRFGAESKMLKVLSQAITVFVGPEGTPKAQRWLRIILGLTVFSPITLALTVFLVLPTMVFTAFLKHTIPVGLGMVVVGILHACLHRPLSWIVNPAMIHLLLYVYRIVGALLLIASMSTAGRVAQEGFQDIRRSLQGHGRPLKVEEGTFGVVDRTIAKGSDYASSIMDQTRDAVVQGLHKDRSQSHSAAKRRRQQH